MKLKLTTKLIFVYLTLTSILVVGLGGYYINTNLEQIRQDSIDAASELSQRVMDHTDRHLKSMDEMAVEIFNHPIYRETIQAMQENRWQDSKAQMKSLLNALYAVRSDIRRAVAYDLNGNYCAAGVSDADRSAVRQRAQNILDAHGDIFQKENGKVFLSPQEDFWYTDSAPAQVITEIRAIRNDETGEILGFLEIQQNAMYLNETVDTLTNGQKLGVMIIMEEMDSIFYERNMTPKLERHWEEILRMTQPQRPIQQTKEFILTRAVSNNFYCHTVVLLDRANLHRYQFSLVSGSMCILLITALMSIFLGVFITRTIMRPINELVMQISKVDLNNLQEKISIEPRSREVSVLMVVFNQMLGRVHTSMLRQKQHEEYQTKALFNAFQREMGPHFLYNSLGSIADLCESGENERAAEACLDLTELLRYASICDVPDVTLEEDLENAKCFMSVMQNRYRQRLIFAYEVDEAALPALLPRMTLQPLLENAIKYSIQERETVHLNLKILYVNRLMMIEIEDNGFAISEERKQYIEERVNAYCGKTETETDDSDVKFGGIGLIGTLTRLRIYYGQSFQYEIKSNAYDGTSILLYMDRV